MINIVGVRFEEAGKIYYFSPAGIDLNIEDKVIVETIRGVELGTVVLGPRDIPKSECVAPLKDIIRKATEEDIAQHRQNLQDAEEAVPICKEKIKKHKLDMKIMGVEYTFDRNKFIVYFTAEGRVDFRALVRDMASVFRTRIELRQIGVRDEAKITGGIGSCGNKVCCKQFLGDFEPVTIKMAKDQGLSLNPSKISGLCGRLMCCLNYENDIYEENLKELPDLGQIVYVPEGKGPVVEVNTLLKEVKVRVKLAGDIEDILTYKLEEISLTEEKDPKYTLVDEIEEIDKELLDLEE